VGRQTILNHIFISETRLQSLVFAVDIVGHKSDIERSNGVYVDTTPPIPTDMIHVDDNMATNPSFEMSNGQFVEWDDIYDIKICRLPTVRFVIV
jgi:hypothetical protein